VTPEEFRKLRQSVGSQAKVAKELDVTIRTLTRWETGEIAIPKMAELALRFAVLQRRARKR
jgi:DNA-binding transcriptional regulator YiaG